MKISGNLRVFLAMALFGSIGVFVKNINLPSMEIAFLRSAIASAGLIIWGIFVSARKGEKDKGGIGRLFKDKRVKLDVKIKVAGILAYLASPIDIMPDFIPMVGKVDDVAIAFFGLNSIINEIPEEIILQNWQGKENIIVTVREAVNYISVAVGSENVSKLLHALGKVLKRKGVKKDGIEVSVHKTKRDKKKKSKEEDDEEEKVGL